MTAPTTTTALAVREAPQAQALMRPIASPAAFLEAIADTHAMIREALKPGVDFGVIQGTGDKSVLLKPGAEKLTVAFGCRAHLVVVEQHVDHDRVVAYSYWDKKARERKESTSLGLYRYVVRCELTRPDGTIVGEGVGSCSTLESKYVSRPRDSENTVLKMASKRAHVAAVLAAFALSEAFTQDIDDAGDVDESEPERAPRMQTRREAERAAAPTVDGDYEEAPKPARITREQGAEIVRLCNALAIGDTREDRAAYLSSSPGLSSPTTGPEADEVIAELRRRVAALDARETAASAEDLTPPH